MKRLRQQLTADESLCDNSRYLQRLRKSNCACRLRLSFSLLQPREAAREIPANHNFRCSLHRVRCLERFVQSSRPGFSFLSIQLLAKLESTEQRKNHPKMSVDLSGGGGGDGSVNLSGNTHAPQTFSIDPSSMGGGGAAPQGQMNPPQAQQQQANVNFSSNPAINAAANMAKNGLDQGLTEMRNFVEQNPSQVRAFVFLVALCQSIYSFLGLFNVFGIVFSLSVTEYLINAYICLFGGITLALEGKPEWPLVASIQERIFFQAHFLSTVNGRAFFYVFQGTLGMARYDKDFLTFLFGTCFFTIGALIVAREYRARKRAAVNGADPDNLLAGQYKV